jgi:hypothetical protein
VQCDVAVQPTSCTSVGRVPVDRIDMTLTGEVDAVVLEEHAQAAGLLAVGPEHGGLRRRHVDRRSSLATSASAAAATTGSKAAGTRRRLTPLVMKPRSDPFERIVAALSPTSNHERQRTAGEPAVDDLARAEHRRAAHASGA